MEQVNFELVGAASYSTLKESFKKGDVYGTTEQLWNEDYSLRTNPAAPEVKLFAKVSPIYQDLQAAGLMDETFLVPSTASTGELDTGAGTGSDTDLSNIPDGSDLSDLDDDTKTNPGGSEVPGNPDAPNGPTTDNPDGSTLTPPDGSETGSATPQTPSAASADSAAKPAGRRVVISPRKAVTV